MFSNSAEHVQALHSNRQVLLNMLQRLNFTQVVVEYEGGGDSGDVSEIKTTPADIAPSRLKEPITIKHAAAVYRDGSYHHDLREEDTTLDSALEAFTMAWVDMNHGGWENNEGGRGTVTIDVLDGTFELAHEHYYTTSSRHAYAL